MINLTNRYHCSIYFYGAILPIGASIRVKITKVDKVLDELIHFVNNKALEMTCDVASLNAELARKIKDKVIVDYSSVAYNVEQGKFITVQSSGDTPLIDIVSATETVKPEEIVSATETVKPEEVVSATETVKPEEVVSATETVQPEEVVSATETVKPEEVVSATETVQPEETVNTEEPVKPEDVANAEETVDLNVKSTKKSSKK